MFVIIVRDQHGHPYVYGDPKTGTPFTTQFAAELHGDKMRAVLNERITRVTTEVRPLVSSAIDALRRTWVGA